MNRILDNLSEPALIKTMEANFFELIKARALWPHAEVCDRPQMLSCFTDVPYPHFNLIVRAQLPQEDVDSAIQSAIELCQSRKVPMGWVIGPATKPATFAENLIAHGFKHIGDNPGMAVDLQTMNDQTKAPAGLTIKQISAGTDIKTWCQVVYTKSGGMPGFVAEAFADLYTCLGHGTDSSMISYYLGLLNGEPVAASMILLGEGVAGIYNVATIPDAQRKGIGSEMTLAALRQAREIGYHVGVLFSSEMGFKVYLRLGFREFCTLGLYLWSGGGANPKAN